MRGLSSDEIPSKTGSTAEPDIDCLGSLLEWAVTIGPQIFGFCIRRLIVTCNTQVIVMICGWLFPDISERCCSKRLRNNHQPSRPMNLNSAKKTKNRNLIFSVAILE